ncbi:MAG: hypothetical protein MZV64_64100 [Ignavibacteriales bacterium]|nr:hypothetical protein [Ignavibacteriales bacterium]
MAMIDGGKYMTIKDVRPVNVVLEYLGLPPVAEGVAELASLTGRTIDADKFRWDDYERGVLLARAGHLPRHDLRPSRSPASPGSPSWPAERRRRGPCKIRGLVLEYRFTFRKEPRTHERDDVGRPGPGRHGRRLHRRQAPQGLDRAVALRGRPGRRRWPGAPASRPGTSSRAPSPTSTSSSSSSRPRCS